MHVDHYRFEFHMENQFPMKLEAELGINVCLNSLRDGEVLSDSTSSNFPIIPKGFLLGCLKIDLIGLLHLTQYLSNPMLLSLHSSTSTQKTHP